jgi:hypothetical protein
MTQQQSKTTVRDKTQKIGLTGVACVESTMNWGYMDSHPEMILIPFDRPFIPHHACAGKLNVACPAEMATAGGKAEKESSSSNRSAMTA